MYCKVATAAVFRRPKTHYSPIYCNKLPVLCFCSVLHLYSITGTFWIYRTLLITPGELYWMVVGFHQRWGGWLVWYTTFASDFIWWCSHHCWCAPSRMVSRGVVTNYPCRAPAPPITHPQKNFSPTHLCIGCKQWGVMEITALQTAILWRAVQP